MTSSVGLPQGALRKERAHQRFATLHDFRSPSASVSSPIVGTSPTSSFSLQAGTSSSPLAAWRNTRAGSPQPIGGQTPSSRARSPVGYMCNSPQSLKAPTGTGSMNLRGKASSDTYFHTGTTSETLRAKASSDPTPTSTCAQSPLMMTRAPRTRHHTLSHFQYTSTEAGYYNPTSSVQSPVGSTTLKRDSVQSPIGSTTLNRDSVQSPIGSTKLKREEVRFASEEIESNGALRNHRRASRSKTLGAMPSLSVDVAVIGPGGGCGINASVYNALGQLDGFKVNIVGQSRAPYDRYPANWANEGAAPPNLESFGLGLAKPGGLVDTSDCIIFGSRGGQVVLPTLWKMRGAEVPPAVVMNGGITMQNPTPVPWPNGAVTFILIGGRDYFRGQVPVHEYATHAQNYVPAGNTTTAILLVNEMTHMPQAPMLLAILPHMVRAAISWKKSGNAPRDIFQTILDSLRRGGWSGKFTYTAKSAVGREWTSEAFP